MTERIAVQYREEATTLRAIAAKESCPDAKAKLLQLATQLERVANEREKALTSGAGRSCELHTGRDA